MATNGIDPIDPITQQQIQIGQLMVQNGQLIIERAQMMQRIAELTAMIPPENKAQPDAAKAKRKPPRLQQAEAATD